MFASFRACLAEFAPRTFACIIMSRRKDTSLLHPSLIRVSCSSLYLLLPMCSLSLILSIVFGFSSSPWPAPWLPGPPVAPPVFFEVLSAVSSVVTISTMYRAYNFSREQLTCRLPFSTADARLRSTRGRVVWHDAGLTPVLLTQALATRGWNGCRVLKLVRLAICGCRWLVVVGTTRYLTVIVRVSRVCHTLLHRFHGRRDRVGRRGSGSSRSRVQVG